MFFRFTIYLVWCLIIYSSLLMKRRTNPGSASRIRKRFKKNQGQESLLQVEHVSSSNDSISDEFFDFSNSVYCGKKIARSSFKPSRCRQLSSVKCLRKEKYFSENVAKGESNGLYVRFFAQFFRLRRFSG